MIPEDPKINVDKQGRVCDTLGRPLRNHAGRSYAGAAFMGRSGSPHPRAGKLDARVRDFEAWEKQGRRVESRRKPGSLKR